MDALTTRQLVAIARHCAVGTVPDRPAPGRAGRQRPIEEDVVTTPLTTNSAPNSRPPSSDALLGRIVRVKLRGELDRALDAIWGAGFALLEAAEAVLERDPHHTQLVDELDVAGEALWRSLETSDRVYCGLAQLCDSLEAPRPRQR